MPNVMIRNNDGHMTLYVPKKDLEETIVSVEHDDESCFGGLIELADGSKYYIEPQKPKPSLPVTLRAKRAESAE